MRATTRWNKRIQQKKLSSITRIQKYIFLSLSVVSFISFFSINYTMFSIFILSLI